LPSKHLETPAYDIERIKSLEGVEDKASHLHIKEEDITIPEFAKQTTPKIEKAAVKEFLPDAPAPVQNKKSSASLIQRFWQRLVGQSKPVETPETSEKSTDSRQPKSGRNNRRDRDRSAGGGRNNNRRNNNKRNGNPNATPEANPTATASAEISHQPEPVELTEINDSQPNQKPNGDRPARRGRNRRRGPRNAGERKTDQTSVESADNQERSAAPIQAVSEPQTRPYDSEFAERKQRTDSESPTSHRSDNAPVQNTASSDD
jgi:ribonuclease E